MNKLQLPTNPGSRKPYVPPTTPGKHDMSGYAIPDGPPQKMAFLIYPNMTALDLVAPLQVLSALGNVQTHLVWKRKEAITSDSGMRIMADTVFGECPRDLTVLFVPGGARGTVALLDDPTVLHFLRESGGRARYVTSVCTGSLLLGAAGLLKGYRATSHWSVRDLLAQYGATPVEKRVVTDRNRVTGAGVTAGFDFALQLTERLRNTKYARALQLGFEYDPEPPHRAGYPTDTDSADVLGMMEAMYFPLRQQIREKAEKKRT